MANKRILIAASMNGGAEAVAPVANRLSDKGIQCRVLLHGAAEKNARDFKAADVLAAVSIKGCREIVARYKPTAILTGTQVQDKDHPRTLEQLLWQAGREAGAKTVAVMDTWGNEVQRFSDLDVSSPTPLSAIAAPLARTPRIITVLDAYQEKIMLGLGFQPETLRVTGNPYFEKVAAEFARLSPATREALLAKPVFSPLGKSGKIVVFMSDSMSDYPDMGFTETSVLQSFLRAVDELARTTGMAINVIVRPHPFRNQDAAGAFNCETPGIRKVLHNPVSARGSEPQNDYTMEQLLHAADLVVGTFNNPLITAKICGRPVVHYLPGINPKYDFQQFMSDQGLSTRVAQEGMLSVVLEGILRGRISQKSMGSVEGAIDRVIALL
ncbi:MAG: hypothetical protein WC350_05250 [Candidatus Micrarchaeia archaeon]|jgi:hypothetical protein